MTQASDWLRLRLMDQSQTWVMSYSRVANTVTMVTVLLHIRLAMKYHIRSHVFKCRWQLPHQNPRPALLRAVYIIIIVVTCIMPVSTDISRAPQPSCSYWGSHTETRTSHEIYTWQNHSPKLISRNVLTNINCHHHHHHHNEDDWHRHQLSTVESV